jgi:uncharacterized protein with WD repeat
MGSRQVKINSLVVDTFSVFDPSTDARVSGETVSNFEVKITHNGVVVTPLFSLVESGNGIYCFSFTPDTLGVWIVEITDRFKRVNRAEHICYSGVIEDLLYYIKDIHKIETGRWKIDTTLNKMFFYDINGTDVLFEFDLYNNVGMPDSTTVFERRPS